MISVFLINCTNRVFFFTSGFISERGWFTSMDSSTVHNQTAAERKAEIWYKNNLPHFVSNYVSVNWSNLCWVNSGCTGYIGFAAKLAVFLIKESYLYSFLVQGGRMCMQSVSRTWEIYIDNVTKTAYYQR